MKVLVRVISRKANGPALHHDEVVDRPKVTLGRGTDQDIYLPNLRVALAHAELVEGNDRRLRLQALASAGFRHNGTITQAAIIAPGDKVELGSFELSFSKGAGVNVVVSVEEIPATRGREMEEALIKRSRLDLVQAGLRRRPWAWALFGTIFVLFLLLPVLGNLIPPMGKAMRWLPLISSDHAWNSGPMSSSHAHFSHNCNICHTLPFIPTRNEACIACHKHTKHHVGPALLATGMFKHSNCGDCHHEHTGQASLIRHDKGLCINCHADLKSRSADTTLENVVDFSDDHPQFKPTLARFAAEQRADIRVSLDDKNALQEESNLEFSHKGHLDAAGITSPSRGKVKLQCSDCHQAEPGGKLMKPVKFEQQCQECHRLNIPGDVAREVPHGNLAAATSAIQDYYAAWALRGGYPNDMAPEAVQQRRRPGQALTAEERTEALGWAEKMSQLATEEMLQYTTCGTCHKATPTKDNGKVTWTLAPVALSTNWLPKAQFDHSKHSTVACLDCHQQAERSERSSDVMLPGIDGCRTCHGGAKSGEGQLASTCITCHGFHVAKDATIGKDEP